MRQPQHKNRARMRSRRQPNPANRVYESNGPDAKVRGTPQQIVEKYMQLARDALSGGDDVKAESYFQHAEHYQRIINAAQEQIQARRQQQEQRRQNGRQRQDERAEDRQPATETSPKADETAAAEAAAEKAAEAETAERNAADTQPAVAWEGEAPAFLTQGVSPDNASAGADGKENTETQNGAQAASAEKPARGNGRARRATRARRKGNGSARGAEAQAADNGGQPEAHQPDPDAPSAPLQDIADASSELGNLKES